MALAFSMQACKTKFRKKYYSRVQAIQKYELNSHNDVLAIIVFCNSRCFL